MWGVKEGRNETDGCQRGRKRDRWGVREGGKEKGGGKRGRKRERWL